MDLLDQVVDTCRRFELLAPGDRVVIGLSGGPDSVALLDVLCRLQDRWKLSLWAVHLNHMLRGEQAEEDLQFCQALAAKRGIRFYGFRYDVASYARELGLNIEDAGRILRYRLFNRVAEENGANRIAVAHHRNDVVETFFMRLLRGAGMQGLASIPPKRGNVVRPFYDVTRRDVEAYCNERKLSFRIDPSNESTKYTRNKIRLELLPYLEKEFSPQLVEIVARTVEVIRAENEYLNELAETEYDLLAEKAWESSFDSSLAVRLSAVALREKPLALQRRILQLAYQDVMQSQYQLSFDHVQELVRILNAPDGGIVNLPHQVTAKAAGPDIIISHRNTELKASPSGQVLAFGENCLSEWGIKVVILRESSAPDLKALAARLAEQKGWPANSSPHWEIWLDAESIKLPLVCSSRQLGDRFRPLGAGGTKKLGDYFTDKKVPVHLRDRIPVLRDQAGIVAVIGYQQDERTRLHSAGKPAIRVIVRKL